MTPPPCTCRTVISSVWVIFLQLISITEMKTTMKTSFKKKKKKLAWMHTPISAIGR